MSKLSSDDCKLLLDFLNTKVTFQGETVIRTWLPIFDKLHEGETGGIEIATSTQEKLDQSKKIEEVKNG